MALEGVERGTWFSRPSGGSVRLDAWKPRREDTPWVERGGGASHRDPRQGLRARSHRPRLLRGHAQALRDLCKDFEAAVAHQQGLAPEKLREDAAQGPHVHGGPVLVRPEEQLRGAVPAARGAPRSACAASHRGAGAPYMVTTCGCISRSGGGTKPAMPKSVSLRLPSSLTRKLLGLMSWRR